jgi:hypothetical protein
MTIKTGDGKRTVLADNTEVYCQAIDNKDTMIKADKTPGKQHIGPCYIVDSKAFYDDIRYIIQYGDQQLQTKASLINYIPHKNTPKHAE